MTVSATDAHGLQNRELTRQQLSAEEAELLQEQRRDSGRAHDARSKMQAWRAIRGEAVQLYDDSPQNGGPKAPAPAVRRRPASATSSAGSRRSGPAEQQRNPLTELMGRAKAAAEEAAAHADARRATDAAEARVSAAAASAARLVRCEAKERQTGDRLAAGIATAEAAAAAAAATASSAAAGGQARRRERNENLVARRRERLAQQESAADADVSGEAAGARRQVKTIYIHTTTITARLLA